MVMKKITSLQLHLNHPAEQVVETIQYVLNNSEEAEEIGFKARKKCIRKYNWDVMDFEVCRFNDTWICYGKIIKFEGSRLDYLC
ncbi:unnamed protein product [marine sediment metagenome]|uniref:Glycosyl transferase family 1 domain-containing protein n=1 Tax=marine sediment metagenome TaxID=412755 RepID=X1BKS0_9ZZZZ